MCMQEIKAEKESSSAYTDIFQVDGHNFDPTGDRSFSQMKLVKTCLRNRLSDNTLPKLMRIAIEGPE